MINALRFVQGAVARKDFVPALQHYLIRSGAIRSFNGTIGLCSPIPCDLDIAPRGEDFNAAIGACAETVALHVAESGKLVIRSGEFRTHVNCVDASSFPQIEPVGRTIKLPLPIQPSLRYLAPFIAEDASRAWACGILLRGECLYATNNVVLVEYWLGAKLPLEIVIPAAAVHELLRIGEEPERLQINERQAFFHFPGGRWLSTQLLTAGWPDLERVLNRDASPAPFPPGFFPALERLLPFVDELGRVYFLEGRLATTPTPDKEGASIDLKGLPEKGCYNLKQLLRLQGVATEVAFDSYPEPCLFQGSHARGVVLGMRV